MIELLYRIWANDLGAIWPIHKTSSVAGVFSTIIPTWISSQFLLGCKNYEVSHPTMQKHTIGQIFIPSMTYLDTTRLSLSTLTPLLPFTGKGWTRLAKRKIKNVCSGMCSICVHLPAHLIFTINELFVYLIGSFKPQPQSYPLLTWRKITLKQLHWIGASYFVQLPALLQNKNKSLD